MKSSSIYDIVWEGKFFNIQLLNRKIEISSWRGSSTSDVSMAISAFEWGVLHVTLGCEIHIQLLDRKFDSSRWMGSSSTCDVRMATSAFEWGVLHATLGWEILPICDFMVGISTCDLSI